MGGGVAAQRIVNPIEREDPSANARIAGQGVRRAPFEEARARRRRRALARRRRPTEDVEPLDVRLVYGQRCRDR